jgi:hypothetical protein
MNGSFPSSSLGTQISGEALLRHLIASSPGDRGTFAELSLQKVMKLIHGSLPFWQFPRSPARLLNYPFPSSFDRAAAALTASMIKPRKPPDSRAWRPAMVVPPGEVTMSLSLAG